MSHFIILQYPYESIEIGLCHQQSIISFANLHKYDAIGLTIPTIENLLMQADLTLKDIDCIGVNIGPGPYNTLRGILTMANGLHYVNQTPLIQLTAFDLMHHEHSHQNHIVIFHAFEQHVFYSLYTNNQVKSQGACSLEKLIDIINTQTIPLHTYGNGAIKYQHILQQKCAQLIFSDHTPSFNNLETLAKQTYQSYKAQHDTLKSYAFPLYFEDLSC